jgi:hypothetical protein
MFSKLLPSLIVFTLTACAFPAAAQVATTQTRHKPQPYTAEFKITQVQTLPNGTKITSESTETNMRDSQGRTVNSVRLDKPTPEDKPYTYGSAYDPVDETRSRWDSRTGKATVTKTPPKEQRIGCWADESGIMRMNFYDRDHPAPVRPAQTQAPHHERTTEDLGNMAIQGLQAHGLRSTYTIPAGEVGNDQPIVTISEQWTARIAPGSSLEVRSVDEDPRTGTRTRELVNLTLGEPDASAFQPPAGYEVTVLELHQVACPQ